MSKMNLERLASQFFTIREADEIFGKLQKEIQFVSRDKSLSNQKTIFREVCFVGDKYPNGLQISYKALKDYTLDIVEWSKTLRWIRDEIFKSTAQYSNFCVVNRLFNNNDHIKFHHEFEKDLLEGSYIILVHFGAPRILEFGNKFGGMDQIVLTNGMMFCLDQEMNVVTKRSIVREQATKGISYRLVFLSVVRCKE